MTTPKITHLNEIQRHILDSFRFRDEVLVHGKYIGDALSLQSQGLIMTELTKDGTAIKCRRAITTQPETLGTGVREG